MREESGSGEIALPELWARSVRRLAAAESKKSGSFSRKSGGRRKGQTSSRSSTNGAVTSIGFEASPAAKSAQTKRYRAAPGLRTQPSQATSMRRKKKAESTSLRSEIQTTDSTRSGCTANNAAVSRLGQ